jgi:rhodanese-related sulfurtransferase
MMRSLGFAEVHEIAGGINAWVEAGLPVVAP